MIRLTRRQEHRAEIQGSQEGGQKKDQRSGPAVCFPIFRHAASCRHNKHLCGAPTVASAVPVGGLHGFGCCKAPERTESTERRAKCGHNIPLMRASCGVRSVVCQVFDI